MLAIDLVRFCAEMLKRLSDCDILLDDYKRVGMCDEYNKLIEEGNKKEYAIALVAEKYIEMAANYLNDPDNPYGEGKIWHYLNG